jgi:hypothetical protein
VHNNIEAIGMDSSDLNKMITDYLKNGGSITVLQAQEAPQDISHRTPWHRGGINNNRKQYTSKGYRATAPGRRIDPGLPNKPRTNRRKTNWYGSTETRQRSV